MASDVLTVIFVTVFLICRVNAEKAFIQAEYEIINDTSSFPWQDLRNEIHQGDAVTYELGTPQYQILNADEPIEIITPDQPGYYESLKRYEAAAMQHAEEFRNQSDSTTTLPEDIEKETVSEKQVKQIANGEEQIRFIIRNLKEKSKNPKMYLGSPNQYQQDGAPAETSKKNNEIKTKQSGVTDTPLWNQQFNDNSDAQSKGNEGERVALSKSVEKTKKNQSFSLKSNVTKELVKSLEESTFMPNTETIHISNSSNTVLPSKFLTESSLTETISATDIPPETPLQLPPTLLKYDTPPTEETSAPLKQNLKEIYATDMSSYAPVYKVPPHIRDFEYLYRSALGIR